MVELSQACASAPETGSVPLLRQGFAGDTLNTAWYARALLGPDWQVDYATQLGQDKLSEQMLRFIEAAGIGTARIARHPCRVAGLYMISLDQGERSFTYWRENSAARCIADDPLWLDRALGDADVIYVSGITFAILKDAGRKTLRAALQKQRTAGAKVVFDPNLRPKLWPDAQVMCGQTEAAATCADIVLPSFEDEAHWFKDADPAATAKRYQALGASEVLVKNGGGRMCFTGADGAIEWLEELPRAVPVDTTGAGDSFNGGYLAARLSGVDVRQAALKGHATALQVIAHHGALVTLA